MGAIIGKENLASIQSVTDNIPGLTTYQCAILGLDTAGKTTVLYRLKFDQYVNAAPTIGFNCEKVRLKYFSFTKFKMKMSHCTVIQFSKEGVKSTSERFVSCYITSDQVIIYFNNVPTVVGPTPYPSVLDF